MSGVAVAAAPGERLRVAVRPAHAYAGAGHLPGLDGLRAIAVAAVVVFHLDVAALPGGFLGVDVFFVISGFLITRLLVGEAIATGRIDLGRFYRRRLRRLFPAVAVLIVAVMFAATWVWRDQLPTLRGSVLSSLGYGTNWWLVFDHQSYFASTGRPPMLQHLWSLAVEEQYYLLWSVLVVLLTGAWAASRRRRGVRLTSVVRAAVGLAVASAVAMGVLAALGNVPYGHDSSRIYFGTDTHSTGLLLGSAAGAWYVMHARRVSTSPPASTLRTDLIGTLALVVLGCAFLRLNEFGPMLYRGGFLALDLVVLAALCSVIRPGSVLGRWLETRPLTWVGKRSYSIYLWHWPVVVVSRTDLDVRGPALLVNAARVGVIVILAAASYRLVEEPFRRSELPRAFSLRLHHRLVGATGVLCTAILLVCSTPVHSWLGHDGRTRAAAHRPTPSASGQRPAAGGAGPPPSTLGANPGQPVPHSDITVSAFGDSVLLGAKPVLETAVHVQDFDAVEGRQAQGVLDDVLTAARDGSLAPVVVIHTGTNGVISPGQLSQTLSALHDRQRVVVLTDKVPRDWQNPNNDVLRRASQDNPNTRLLDWQVIAAEHPEWFWQDGIHLNPAGQAAYVTLIVAAAQS
jgi:peptidoglycan/LPS O-acetylase OafA/YrhL